MMGFRCPDSEAATFVRRRIPFINRSSTLFGEYIGAPPLTYVVCLYGNHAIIFVYDFAAGQWFGEAKRFLECRHEVAEEWVEQVRPKEKIIKLSRKHLRYVANQGYAALVSLRLKGGDVNPVFAETGP